MYYNLGVRVCDKGIDALGAFSKTYHVSYHARSWSPRIGIGIGIWDLGIRSGW